MGTAPQSVSLPALLPRARALGSDFAPPRQLYYAYIPASLWLIGIITWTTGNESVMVLASIAATVVVIFTLWDWLFRHGPTRFSTLLGMSLLLGYGSGTLNTWLTLPRGSLNLAEFMGLSESLLARGLGAVLISSACLYCLGEIFEKPIFGRNFRLAIDARTRTLIYVGALAMLGGYAAHMLGIGGAASGRGHVSVPGVFLSWLYPPLTALSAAAFVTAESKTDRVLTAISSLILLALFSVMGRRVTFYTSFEVLLVLGIVGFRWREKFLRNIILILSLGAIMVAGALTFMLLRIAAGTTRKEVTVGKRIEIAGKLVQKGGAYALATKTTQQNFQTRTFVLGFFANILDASARKTPGLGADAVGLMQSAIPSILYPDKNPYFSEEKFVDEQFGFGYIDEANSLLTAGAADFGLIGLLLYPLIVVALFRILFDFVARWLGIIPLLFVALSFIFLFLQTESVLTGYFEVMRDSFFFGIALALFMSLPTIKLHHPTRYD